MSNLTTGLNPDRAKADITNFQDEYFTATAKCEKALTDFLAILEENWASPNAVSFQQNYQDRWIDAFVNRPNAEGNKIVDGAVEAFNSISSANGGPTISIGARMNGYPGVNIKEEIDGEIGMNIANVAVALNEFKANLTDALTDLINVPKEIAFYDPAGEQVATYQTGILAVHNYIDSTQNLVAGLVGTAITEEQNNINLGKQGSVDALEYIAPMAV